MEFLGVLKKYNVEILGVNWKRIGIFSGDQEKFMLIVDFLWVLVFGLEIPKECNIILWNFKRWSFILSKISNSKVMSLKIPGFFKNICPQVPPPV